MDEPIKGEEMPVVEEKPAQTVQAKDADAGPMPDGEVDPQVITLALATGGQILDYVARGDEEGLMQFVQQIRDEIARQKRMMQLLSMEQKDLDALIQSLQQPAAEPAAQPAAAEGANSPVKELYSPADRMGKKPSKKGGSLWEYIRGE